MHEKDLLQRILEGAKSYDDYNITIEKFIVDNCKNLYFAGHETTAVSASWSMVMLAAYPEWQARARAEVFQICGDGLPTADMLRNMKTLTMVIQETLRLYPPAAMQVREAMQDMKFGNLEIPKGFNISIPTPIMHQRPDVWGPDVHQFNPERFAEGINGACTNPLVYMPFGIGPRICVGQHFAMTELKVIVSLILSKFSFSLSPTYRHSPAFRLTIEPEHGVHLLLKRL